MKVVPALRTHDHQSLALGVWHAVRAQQRDDTHGLWDVSAAHVELEQCVEESTVDESELLGHG